MSDHVGIDDEEVEWRQHVLETLGECVRELALARYTMAENAGAKPGDILPGHAESDAREIIAPFLQGVTDEEREAYRVGQLGPKTMRLTVIEGGMD